MRIVVPCLITALCIFNTPALAQVTVSPSLAVPRLEAAPDFEAFVSMHPPADAVRGMTTVENFTQRWPDDGKAERFRTVAYVGYTDEALHVVYLAFDPDPAALRAHLIRREEVFTVNDDEVELRLDTYGDRRQSYYFVSNPLGVQLDAAWPEVGGQYDESFDLLWHSRGRTTAEGFVVAMDIPFRSLRFKPGPDQPWGIYLGRWIPRTGEWNFWPPISNRQQSYLAQMAQVEGLRDIRRGRGVQLIPYSSYRAFSALDRRDASRPAFVRDLRDVSAGLDAKFVVRDALVVDAAVNPDFSQVESDAPQITANQRFEVFFPEKRPFFLENAGILQTPITLMFTRRVADPEIGGKLTGRAGAWSIGALVADDEAPGKRLPDAHPANGARAWVTAIRASRNLFGQSGIGGIVTHRTVNGRVNTVSSIDSRIRLGKVWTADGQVAVSSLDESAPARSSTGSAYLFALARNGRTVSSRTEIDGRSADFVTDLGFVPRLDVHEITQTVSYTARPAKTLTDWGPSLLLERAWAHDGSPLDWRARPAVAFNLRRSTSFTIFAERSGVTLRPGDAPNLQSALRLQPVALGVTAGTSPRAAWGASISLTTGRGINFTPAPGVVPALGNQTGLRVSLSLRPLTPLRIENTWLRAALESGGARAFVSDILRSQWAWQFTREWSFRFIGQYDDLAVDRARSSLSPRRNFNADALLTRLVNPWTAIYVGVNSNAQGDHLARDAWQVFVKWSHLLRW